MFAKITGSNTLSESSGSSIDLNCPFRTDVKEQFCQSEFTRLLNLISNIELTPAQQLDVKYSKFGKTNDCTGFWQWDNETSKN